MNPPPFGFGMDNPNPHGGWYDGGAQIPVPLPDAGPFIVREATGQPLAPRAAPARGPASAMFEDRFADFQGGLPRNSDDHRTRIAGYETIAGLGEELKNISPALQRTYWQLMVNAMPAQEHSHLLSLHSDQLYESKAGACAALYEFLPQARTWSESGCARYVDMMEKVMDDLMRHRKAGAPTLALMRTFTFRLKGHENYYPQYAKIYPLVKKIVDDLPDRDPYKPECQRIAELVATPGYQPLETRPNFAA